MLREDKSSIEVSATTETTMGLIICSVSPLVRIDENGSYNHAGRNWQANELVRHLIVDMDEQPFGAVSIIAEGSVNHQTVVNLSDLIKQQFPEVNVIWESYSQINKPIK